MANYTVGVTAVLVEQISGLDSSTVYNGFKFELRTASGTITNKTYDIAVTFNDDTTSPQANYIFQPNVTTGANFGTVVPFTLPGTYYSIGGGASVTGVAATVFDFHIA